MAKKVVGKVKDYRAMYNDLKMELSGAPHDIRYDKLNEFYKKIVDTANHRLLEIERFAEKPKYKEVKQFAYRLAIRQIESDYGEGAKRFRSSGLSEDFRVTPKQINKVLSFLEMPTSTRLGVYEVYEKRASTVSDRYKIDVNWNTIANLYQSTLYKKTAKGYGSKTAIQAIGVIQKNKKEVLDALRKEKPISFQVEDAEVERTVNNFLKFYKKDVKKLMKKI